MPELGTHPSRSPVRNGIVGEVHGIAVVIGKGDLLIRRGFRTRKLAIVVMGMTMAMIEAKQGEAAEMKMRTPGVLGHPDPCMRMRDRHALGKLDEYQDGWNHATHHLVRLLRQILFVYFSRRYRSKQDSLIHGVALGHRQLSPRRMPEEKTEWIIDITACIDYSHSATIPASFSS